MVLGSRPAASAHVAKPVAPAPASPAATSQQPIDAESLLRRCRGKGPLAERLLVQFEQQLAGQVESLRESLGRSDRESLTRLAHAVKGSAANMSAGALSDAAAELERLAASADPDAAAACLERVAGQARQCADFIATAVERVRQQGTEQAETKTS